ncbi:MOSC beta barrel domain protein [Ancylostoma ceylanicum]|uniref:MOSC beta barrel domain protein n=1 Tax=Ancylostoma ceylanicum TaxID=53326 RepID=A0A0D6M8L2_9BILA|nr:MOSC beta barrel domain protein [Ancylostoma ceylanicum]
MVLEHFDVTNEQYAVVFTANATHALQLVADCFIFGENTSPALGIGSVAQHAGPTFAYMRDSHNSVVGMREIVKERVNNILCLDNIEDQLLAQNGDCRGPAATEHGLFAMTAMSNFCGRKYDLSVVEHLQQRDATHRLKPRAFAGGTVSQMLIDEFHSVLRDKVEERFEHGTLNYYAICALTKGFADLNRYGSWFIKDATIDTLDQPKCVIPGGIQAINEITMRIAKAAYEMLIQKTHWNGRPAVKIYGWCEPAQQGPIVTFNLLRDDGSYTGYSEKGKECGDTKDVIDGRPTGAVRISFGRQSTIEDVLVLEQMIDYCFLGAQPSIDINHPLKIEQYSATISRLIVYPVKSCRGIDLERSHLTKTGLQYDRVFMIECCGTTLTQKRHEKMCKIVTKIDEPTAMLSLYNADDPLSSVELPLFTFQKSLHTGIVCLTNVQTSECAAAASTWVTTILGLSDCKLRRVAQDSSKSLSNEAPYLVVNEASIKILADVVVVRGIPPFLEDTAKYMSIDGFRFEMTFGIYVKQIGDKTGEIHRNSTVHFE